MPFDVKCNIISNMLLSILISVYNHCLWQQCNVVLKCDFNLECYHVGTKILYSKIKTKQVKILPFIYMLLNRYKRTPI